MSLYLVLFLIFGCLLVYRYTLGDALAKIPGPVTATISRLWLVYHSRRGDMHRTMIDLHKKYGKLVRTGSREISVSDLSAIKTIYGAGSKFRKSEWYSVWQGHRKFDLFGERDEKVHASQRRLVGNIYTMESLKDSETYVDSAIQFFMSKLEENQGQRIDMGLWVHLFAFDIIGEVTFSKRFGFMDAGKDDGSLRQIQDALKSGAWIGQMPWLYWIHDFLIPVLGNHLDINARHGGLRNLAAQEIQSRTERGSDRQDILAKLFTVQKEKPNEMSENGVLSMATSNIFAGSDTTAISIRSILYHLCKNPQCKSKLIHELDEFQMAENLTDIITLDQAKKLKYLQACIHEALRIYPAIGMNLPRVTPPGGIEIGGQYIPEGTVIGVNPWVVHRDTTVFGEDVDIFRPERWLKDDTGNMERYFFTFGSGARGCLGKNLSWMEMSKLIPALFLRFDIQLTDPTAEWTETCWWFVKQDGLNMTLRPRQRVWS